jgi:hypothetical protein
MVENVGMGRGSSPSPEASGAEKAAQAEVVEEQVGEELVAADLEAVLAAHEGEPGAELEEEALEVSDESVFEFALGHVGTETEELQVVGILGDLLDQFGLAGRQGPGEVRWSGAKPTVEFAHDLVEQDIAAPAVFDGLLGVPLPQVVVVEPVEQDRDVTPGKLCNRLLHNLGPRLGECSHVHQVPAREPLHVRELGAQVGGESLDDPGPPPFGLLAAQNEPPELPVEMYNFAVDRQVGPKPGIPNRGLRLGEQSGVAIRI